MNLYMTMMAATEGWNKEIIQLINIFLQYFDYNVFGTKIIC